MGTDNGLGAVDWSIPGGRDRRDSVASQVYRLLRTEIVELQLAPRTRLSEKDLALRLGVSRSPVREALLKLSDEGLVWIRPQSGTAVAPISISEVNDGQFVREALETLPGVGRKTANVVLNIAFGEPTIAVDTHIFRVGNRTGLAPGKTPFEVEEKLLEVVPDEFKRHAHHWLILHGRYVCIARRPLCEKCLIADLCRYPAKTLPVSA